MTPNPRFPNAGQLLTDSDGVCVGNSYAGYLKAALAKGQISPSDIPYKEHLGQSSIATQRESEKKKRTIKYVTKW